MRQQSQKQVFVARKADETNEHVKRFTYEMDLLLKEGWLAYASALHVSPEYCYALLFKHEDGSPPIHRPFYKGGRSAVAAQEED